MGLPIRWDQCPDWQHVEITQPEMRPLRRKRRRTGLLRRMAIAGSFALSVGVLGLAGVGAASLLSRTTAPSLRLSPAHNAGSAVGLAAASVERKLGFVTVTGNASNLTARTVGEVEAVVELLNAQGQTVKVESALLTGSLPGKASGPFAVVMNDDPKAVAYRVQFKRLMSGTVN